MTSSNRTWTVGLLLTVCLLSVAAGNGFAQTISFGPSSEIPSYHPFDLAISDLNADGNADVTAATADDPHKFYNTFDVFNGDGTGSFPSASSVWGWMGARSVAIADFNRDGKPDVAIVNDNANPSSVQNTVAIFLNSGGFQQMGGPGAGFKVGYLPRSVASGDFNGDGIADLAVANTGSNDVSILIGLGTGAFQLGPNFVAPFFAAGTEPVDVTVGDLNRDGKHDLAVTNENATTHHITVLTGNGGGGFGTPLTFPLKFSAKNVVVADFNADCRPDLAAANFLDNSISILLNTTSYFSRCFKVHSTFTTLKTPFSILLECKQNPTCWGDPRRFAVANMNSDALSRYRGEGEVFMPLEPVSVGLAPVSLVGADFTGDGILDMAVANRNGNTVTILRGGDKDSLKPVAEIHVGAGPVSVTEGDFNMDGIPDLAVANSRSSTVSILIGLGNGSFETVAEVRVGKSPSSVAAGDLNQDGRPDVVVANRDGNTISILPGTGTGAFEKVVTIPVGSGPQSIAIGDLNMDKIPDLAVANAKDDTVSVLFGAGDGYFDEPRHYQAGMGPYSIGIGDLNSDRRPDLAVANFLGDTVSIFDGASSFKSKTEVSVGFFPASIAIGDLTGDGAADVAVANSGSNEVMILSLKRK